MKNAIRRPLSSGLGSRMCNMRSNTKGTLQAAECLLCQRSPCPMSALPFGRNGYKTCMNTLTQRASSHLKEYHLSVMDTWMCTSMPQGPSLPCFCYCPRSHAQELSVICFGMYSFSQQPCCSMCMACIERPSHIFTWPSCHSAVPTFTTHPSLLMRVTSTANIWCASWQALVWLWPKQRHGDSGQQPMWTYHLQSIQRIHYYRRQCGMHICASMQTKAWSSKRSTQAPQDTIPLSLSSPVLNVLHSIQPTTQGRTYPPMLKQALLLPWVKKPLHLLFTQRMPEKAMLILHMLMSRRMRTLEWAQPRVAILSSTVQMSHVYLDLWYLCIWYLLWQYYHCVILSSLRDMYFVGEGVRQQWLWCLTLSNHKSIWKLMRITHWCVWP